jgi:PAS domain S-box-containing protein
MSTRVIGWLATALRGADDGAFATMDGKVVLWNAAIARRLGYTARDVIGQPWEDLICGHPEDGRHVCDRHEPIHTFDMRARTKSGRPLWVTMSVLIIPGAPTVHLIRDVTATRRLLTLVQEHLSSGVSSTNGAVRTDAALTPRELEILGLLAQGHNTARVVERLRVSRATVRNHVQNILAKLGVHSRLEAVAYATRQRLV